MSPPKKKKMTKSRVAVYDMQPRLRRKEMKRRKRLVRVMVFLLALFLLTTAGFVLNTEPFRVRVIEVSDAQRRVSAVDIYHDSNIHIGQNILFLRVGAARAALERKPLVKSVEIQRKLPSRVRIIVREREPFAVVSDGARMYLVDDERVVLEIPRRMPAGAKLIRVTGERVLPADVGDRLVFPNSGDFLNVCRALQGIPDLAYDRVAFNGNGIKVLLKDGTYVLLGDGSDVARKVALIPPLTRKLKDAGRKFLGLNLKSLDMPSFIEKPEPEAQTKQAGT